VRVLVGILAFWLAIAVIEAATINTKTTGNGATPVAASDLSNGTTGSGQVVLDTGATINAGSLSIGGTAVQVSGGGSYSVVSFQPGAQTAVITTKGGFAKIVKASTVDNIIGSASAFTCSVNPVVTVYECGTSATCAVSPTTLGAATVTASGQAFSATVSSPAITAGDYVAFAVSAGTCTVLDISANVQLHAN
jgi:hypothetical protein